ncbi:MAG TPA: DNA polymerase III subunit delta [Candidatus Dormibacteraeota bacterium]
MPGPARVLLLHGEESFLIAEQARAQQKEWTKDLVSDFGLETVDGSALTMERLRDAVLQAPFLDPHRVVVAMGIAARRADTLAPALAEVPESTRVLLTVNGRLPASSKLLKAAGALPGGQARDLAPLRGRAVGDWVQQRARQLGLPPAVAAQVVRATPPDLGVLASELHKLAAFAEGGGDLDPGTLRDLLAGGRQEEVYRLTDHLLPQPGPDAFRVLDELLERENPTTIAYRLARHLALVLEVRTRQERGESLSQLQASMREHSFVVQKAYDAARGSDANRLERGLRVLLDYEWEVKSGQIDAELGLRVALARL